MSAAAAGGQNQTIFGQEFTLYEVDGDGWCFYRVLLKNFFPTVDVNALPKDFLYKFACALAERMMTMTEKRFLNAIPNGATYRIYTSTGEETDRVGYVTQIHANPSAEYVELEHDASLPADDFKRQFVTTADDYINGLKTPPVI